MKAKRLIQENSGTIRKLADQISNGGFTKMRQEEARRREKPKPEGLIIHDLKAPSKPDTPDPYVKVSINNRVVLADASSGRQLQLLGEIRRNGFSKAFVLATKANGYRSPVSDETYAAIQHLSQAAITQEFSEASLVQEIEKALGIKR